MIKPESFLSLFLTLFLTAGCQTVSEKKETPKEAASAVQSVVSGVTGKAVRAKYCPVCGRHYGPRVLTCPADGTILKEIEE